MFTEILRIKPVLDSGNAAAMEQSLQARFTRVAKRFGAGLKAVIKGSVIGISLGLLSKLLNPLEALEERLKKLMGEGSDLRDLADRFNTTPGKILTVQSVAKSFGVKEDELKDAMTKYAETIEAARKEVAELPAARRSEKTRMLDKAGLLDEKDFAQGFVEFLDSLKRAGKGPGHDVFLTEAAQAEATRRAQRGQTFSESERDAMIARRELVHRTGAQTQAELETDILGGRQFGPMKRFIGADFMKRAAEIHLPQSEVLTGAATKAAGLNDVAAKGAVEGDVRDFVATSNIARTSMVQAMQKLENDKDAKERAQLKNFDTFVKAAEAINDLKGIFDNLSLQIARLLKVIEPALIYLTRFTSEAFWIGIFKRVRGGP
jgi:hypothetical protein